MHDTQSKITESHLERNAYLYVRQSTLQQVMENTESTKRQYGLKDRAVALGWPIERIVVIDSDLGQSAAVADRKGFKQLVQEVSLGKAGVVLGLEVSRLARNSADWHRLLELCALTETLIIDEDGLYDPSHFNDRLLLGLKGTMSEAELHVLRSRMRGGLMNKAKRGDLRAPIPIGFAYDLDDRVILEPNTEVQQAVRRLFEIYSRTGSAMATVREFRAKNWLFPMRDHRWSRKPEFIWSPLEHRVVCRVLKNPRYTGAFVYCRTRQRKHPGGRVSWHSLPRDQWILIKGAHPAYISWEQYEENVQKLVNNTRCFGADRRRNPTREGPALLQGLVICGRCGRRMTVKYYMHRGNRYAYYYCGKEGLEQSLPLCQSIHGEALDAAIGKIAIDAMNPSSLKTTLQVQEEVVARAEEADALRLEHVKRSRQNADIAQQRFLRVDPANRRVADELEADWNAKLQALTQAHDEYENTQYFDKRLNEEQRAEILALGKDFAALWSDPDLLNVERKHLVRLIVADVTLLKSNKVHADVRFAGGATRRLELMPPKKLPEFRTTDARIIQELDCLIDTCTDKEIANRFNRKGIHSNTTRPFTRVRITRLRHAYKLKDRRTRLIEAGMLTPAQFAKLCRVDTPTVYHWRLQGLLRAHRASNRGSYGDFLYEPPTRKFLAKHKGKKIVRSRKITADKQGKRGIVRLRQ